MLSVAFFIVMLSVVILGAHERPLMLPIITAESAECHLCWMPRSYCYTECCYSGCHRATKNGRDKAEKYPGKEGF